MIPKTRDDLIVSVVDSDGTTEVHDPAGGVVRTLPPLQAWVLEQCDGERSVDAIRDQLTAIVETRIAHEALWQIIDGFDEAGLLERRPAPRGAANYAVNRRGLLKGLVALPAAAVAAQPAVAQEGGNVEQIQKAAEQQAKDAQEDAEKAAEQAQKGADQAEQARKAAEQLDKIQEQAQKGGGGETGSKEMGTKEANNKAPTQVPAPGAVALLGTGLGAVAVKRLLQRRAALTENKGSD